MSQRLGLKSLETYVVKRQLQWAGHVARMKENRLPRKLLTAWCYNKRPKERPKFTHGEGLEFALSYAKVDRDSWMEQAKEKGNWQAMLKAIGTGAPELDLHPLLVARSEYIPPPPPPPSPTATASAAPSRSPPASHPRPRPNRHPTRRPSQSVSHLVFGSHPKLYNFGLSTSRPSPTYLALVFCVQE